MLGMIFADSLTAKLFRCGTKEASDKQEQSPLVINDTKLKSNDKTVPIGSFKYWLGIFMSMMGGIFGAIQYAVITLGKQYEEQRHNCYHKEHDTKNVTKCPAVVTESFNDFGSWMVALQLLALFLFHFSFY